MKCIFTLLLVFEAFTCFAQQPKQIDQDLLLDYYQNQRFTEAADYLKQIYTEPVSNPKALAQLAYTSQMSGRLADAEKYYQRIYENDSTNTGVLFSLGSINLRRGNSAKAEIYYKKIAERDSTNFMVYKQLAQISKDNGNIASYLVNLQKANQLNTTDPDVASDLSEIYISLQQNDQAEKVLNKAIEADPENTVLMLSLMKLTYAQKKWQQTADLCQKLMQNGNTSGMVLTKLGVAYYNLKNFACGAETFADIEPNAQNEFSFYYAAMCYKALNDQKMAIYYLNKAIVDGISPSIASYYGEIANSNEKLKRYRNALTAYQKGLQFKESPLLFYSIALLYDEHIKSRANALKYYRKYLSSHPPEEQKDLIKYCKSRVAALRR
ncbi:tetratricopeptide repeat protein [Mucilaginibacter segetis]|uniref:Tetratricopeptide repeat protein n=1 Tax=Mucilaginibacter segetis TaxID=2793071 RepID=A0A934PQN6_9SPHI|nr:tetratricopeptide repeat protein [Mucilaginibacter segetis]MBK0378979.1 tetratricopeptide repeat protein [Mucilaginibacter segetis]